MNRSRPSQTHIHTNRALHTNHNTTCCACNALHRALPVRVLTKICMVNTSLPTTKVNRLFLFLHAWTCFCFQRRRCGWCWYDGCCLAVCFSPHSVCQSRYRLLAHVWPSTETENEQNDGQVCFNNEVGDNGDGYIFWLGAQTRGSTPNYTHMHMDVDIYIYSFIHSFSLSYFITSSDIRCNRCINQ